MTDTYVETSGGGIEFDPTKASKGGLQSIIEFQGVIVKHERIPNKFGETRKKYGTDIDEPAPDQIQVSYEDVEITEMEEGEEEPELKDGKFSILINYAKPGHPKPHNLSQWAKGYADTCVAVHGKLPNEMEGQVVTMRRKDVEMKIRNRDTGEDEIVTARRWCFVGESSVTPETLEERARKLIEGKNRAAALRAVAQDNQLRKDATYKDAINEGKSVAGLTLVEGVYVDETKSEAKSG